MLLEFGQVGCDKKAKWMIIDKDSLMPTYSCNEHLLEMQTETTVDVVVYEGEELCCFIASYNDMGCECLDCLMRWGY